jgi:hypothetical protein
MQDSATKNSQRSLDSQLDEVDETAFIHAVNEKLRDAPLSTQSQDALEKAAAESAAAATAASSRTGLARVHDLAVEKNDNRDCAGLKNGSNVSKADFTLRFTADLNERELRKLFFAAAVVVSATKTPTSSATSQDRPF